MALILIRKPSFTRWVLTWVFNKSYSNKLTLNLLDDEKINPYFTFCDPDQQQFRL